MTGDMGDHTLSGQTAGNRQNWRQLILNPFKNDLFEMCGECVQTIFTFKGLDVTGVKNGITGTLRAAAPKLCAPFEIKCKTWQNFDRKYFQNKRFLIDS